MKFAKELEEDLVPEWRVKYLDYKTGKKKIKAVARAIAHANGTPRLLNRDNVFSRQYNSSPLSRMNNGIDGFKPVEPLRRSPVARGNPRPGSEESSEDQKVTTPMLMPNQRGAKREQSTEMQYGSFVPTPPSSSRLVQPLELPAPALTSDSEIQSSSNRTGSISSKLKPKTDPLQTMQRSASLSTSGSAYEVGGTTSRSQKPKPTPLSSRRVQTLPPNPQASGGAIGASPKLFMKRILTSSRLRGTMPSKGDVNLPSFDQVRARNKEFYQWMDKELDKVEGFYKSKEDEAEARLRILREQLHEMRNCRIDEIAESRRVREIRKDDEHAIEDTITPHKQIFDHQDKSRPGARDQLHAWMEPIERMIENARTGAIGHRPGKNTNALQNMQKSPDMSSKDHQNHHERLDDGRDYVRKPNHDHEVPYRSAKRKLKLALKEYYRGLELLKSYALLNRTAFRKINKKYDKAVNTRQPLRYMSEKVNKAWFVQSNVLERYLHGVEDLYARYFERGNHKVAVGKLRSSSGKLGDYAGSTFRIGLLVGTGGVFAVQGLIYATDLLLHEPDQTLVDQTSYLLQIYAGYFLALYLFAWFCLDCSIWARNKINYVFVFEFDPRDHLDWRQLFELPAFLLLALGLLMWLNFSRFGPPEVFIYYPVILIFASVVVIFLPAPILFYRSRRWFVYSHWRLLLAGLYPVEFRDFFLGDMYCSLTYFMSNIGLFFCLYAQHWGNPPQCNSSHSRLVGFFSTLPGIWRALQCIRRYYDTRNVFPHLLNCGKYSMTIMYYVSLSLYRIQNERSILALFITFATLNAVYCSIWDLAMDWSLCQPNAQKRFLRDFRGYKSTWPYYMAMVIDPILRFNWIFYVAYTHDLQHSSIASFLIAFSEISRRGMWTIFRVENEHCANVARFKASRDVPLPYPLSEADADTFARHDTGSDTPDHEYETAAANTQTSPTLSRHRSRSAAAEEGLATAVRGSPASGGAPSTLRRRAPTRKLTTLFAEAHTHDFEKKRRPTVGGASGSGVRDIRGRPPETDDEQKRSSDDEEDEEDDTLGMLDLGKLAESRRREVDK